jgi:2-polyprenyl-6-hydroxyphenyl methylase / 3-demethylubiquinone-9 3-methyltransferase
VLRRLYRAAARSVAGDCERPVCRYVTSMNRSIGTIDPAEVAHFGKLAEDWWSPDGRSKMLHKLNPVRLKFVRDAIDDHWGKSRREFKPLQEMTALDVGSGAGLLCEPLARMGASVTGIDAAPENVELARQHAKRQGLPIKYLAQDVVDLKGEFDLICAMEVIEHVTNAGTFFHALCKNLADKGMLIVSTPNRTAIAKLAMIAIGEGLGAIPKGTHDWEKFVMPDELIELAQGNGLKLIRSAGVTFSPSKGLKLSENLDVNYLMAFTHI